MGDSASRSTRPAWLIPAIVCGAAFVAGGALMYGVLRGNILERKEPNLTPPAPRESVPTAPGPDNTITDAPPPPPSGLPSPEQEDEGGDAGEGGPLSRG